MILLKNKDPEWNMNSNSHTLDFHGRATHPSVKNFQIIYPDMGKCIKSGYSYAHSNYAWLDGISRMLYVFQAVY